MLLGLMGLVMIYGCGPDRAYEEYLQGREAEEAQALDVAFAHYDRSLALDSTRAEAYLGRGRIHWISQQHERALADLNRALELDPDLTWAYYLRGASRMNLRAFDDAVADLTQAIISEALPDDMLRRALHLRGIGYMNLDRLDEAIADISACIERDHEQERPGYYFERARLYETTGQLDGAIADYESFLALNPVPNEQTGEVEQKLIVLRAQ